MFFDQFVELNFKICLCLSRHDKSIIFFLFRRIGANNRIYTLRLDSRVITQVEKSSRLLSFENLVVQRVNTLRFKFFEVVFHHFKLFDWVSLPINNFSDNSKGVF